MATFTMELREVIESLYGTSMDEDDYVQEYKAVTFNKITYGKLPVLPEYNSIGLGYYPIFDENYREIINGKILDEYWVREIGLESIELFVLALKRKMDQIMPYYNQLFESTLIEYNALDTMRIHSVGKSKMNGQEANEVTQDTTTSNKSGSRVVGSDFPQSMLAGNADYARTGTDSTSDVEIGVDGKTNTESNSNTESDSDTLVTGFQGAASDLINKYRGTLLNIDTMILGDIEDCFMGLLNTGDEYFARY